MFHAMPVEKIKLKRKKVTQKYQFYGMGMQLTMP